MTTCPNCDATIDDYGECVWCLYNREQLRERLNGCDGAVGLSVVVGWALHGWDKQPERAWWIA